jgi:hypothetical protein
MRGATGGFISEVAVAIRHERVDVGIALARPNHLLDFAPEFRGERRIESAMLGCDNEAAQVADQP